MLVLCVCVFTVVISSSKAILDPELIEEFFSVNFDSMGTIFHCEKSCKGLSEIKTDTRMVLQRSFIPEVIPIAKRMVVYRNFRLSFNKMHDSDIDIEAVFDKNATLGVVMDGTCEEALEYLIKVKFSLFVAFEKI